MIDATFLSPLGICPLELGADLVVHSASKYLNGHSDLIAGVVTGSRKLVDRVWQTMLTLGGSLDPHACFLLERGLKTLALRMNAHSENALELARLLEAHPAVTRVYFPGLPSHPDHDLARSTLRCWGGVVTFELAAGDPGALRFLDALRWIQPATSLGGVESLASLPFNTSHATLSPKQREAIGVGPGCVRLSVGIEQVEDLVEDIERGLQAAEDEG